jgi:L-ascorbate metabolism protein UlaG (beta-lactamase superfamily)
MELGNLEVKWKGHASFLIEDLKSGKRIYIDPYNIEEGEGDIILITHAHYDHCSVEDLKKVVKEGTAIICPADCQSKLTKIEKDIDIKIIKPGKTENIGEISIEAVPAYNIEKSFHEKSHEWVGYIIDIGGKRIYHAGDTDLIPEINDIGGEGKIDLALLPVGGNYTMDSKDAAKAAFLLKPGLAVPMHFGDIVGSREDAENFVSLCKEEGINCKIMDKE